LEQQKDLVVRARGFDAAKECTGKSLEALRAVRANILNEVLP
jgi:hypothetical protein